jgi:hypothetical protein
MDASRICLYDTPGTLSNGAKRSILQNGISILPRGQCESIAEVTEPNFAGSERVPLCQRP